MKPCVSFSTKCWEGDYRSALGEAGSAAEQVARCVYPFTLRQVIVNNVVDDVEAEVLGDLALWRGDVDRVLFASDYADVVLGHFKLTREDLGRGYVYSICEMTEIFLADEPYLLHFAGDVALTESMDWIPRAVEILETSPNIAVVNPLWNGRLAEAEAESLADAGDHLVGYGFSDQCYLVRVADFREDILRETHPAGARYPAYGGELFEKRVDAWMRNHGRLRATMKYVSYTHPWRWEERSAA